MYRFSKREIAEAASEAEHRIEEKSAKLAYGIAMNLHEYYGAWKPRFRRNRNRYSGNLETTDFVGGIIPARRSHESGK